MTEMSRSLAAEGTMTGGEESRAAGMCPTCGRVHLFESREVRRRWWWPSQPTCLIIGESPGPPGAAYFYDPIPTGRDPVAVRRHLLAGLTRAKLVSSNTLEAFAVSGFVFDHALRCQLEMARIERERTLARKYDSPLAEQATHLVEFIGQFPRVWVMGHMARNAVACQDQSLPAVCRLLTPPYVVPGVGDRDAEDRQFFVSRYFTRFDKDATVDAIIGPLRQFLVGKRGG